MSLELPQNLEDKDLEEVIEIFMNHTDIFKDQRTLTYIQYFSKCIDSYDTSIADKQRIIEILQEHEHKFFNTLLFLAHISLKELIPNATKFLIKLIKNEILLGDEMNEKDQDIFMVMALQCFKKESTQLLDKLINLLDEYEDYYGEPIVRLDRQDYKGNNLFHYISDIVKNTVNLQSNSYNEYIENIHLFLLRCNVFSVDKVNESKKLTNENGNTPLELLEDTRIRIEQEHSVESTSYTSFMKIYDYMKNEQEEDEHLMTYIHEKLSSLSPISESDEDSLSESNEESSHPSEQLVQSSTQVHRVALHENAHFIDGFINTRIAVNITKTIEFYDPINLETKDVVIHDYLKEDLNNIVIVYNTNEYFLTNRKIIQNVIKDAMVYPCRIADSISPESVDTTKPLFNMRKIAFPLGYYSNIQSLISNLSHQMFGLVVMKKKYPSYISYKLYHQEDMNMVGALHCQSGQESFVSQLIPAYPSIKDNPESLIMNESELPQHHQEGGKKKKGNKKKKTRKQNKGKRNKKKTRKRKI